MAGHSDLRCAIGPRGPQGIGFKLINGKQYDIQGKQLKNLGDPQGELNATTLKYVNEVCKIFRHL